MKVTGRNRAHLHSQPGLLYKECEPRVAGTESFFDVSNRTVTPFCNWPQVTRNELGVEVGVNEQEVGRGPCSTVILRISSK